MTYEITYTGRGLSLNSVKSQHWRKTEKQKNDLKEIFSILIAAAKIKFMKRFKLFIYFNSRHDADNVSPLGKLLCDILRRKGYIIDDSRKYYRGFSIEPDETLPPNTYKFIISEV